MVAMQVRDVPDDVRAELIASAQRRGLSLQRYLREVLEREAREVRRGRWLDDVRPSEPGSGQAPSATELIRRDRDGDGTA